MKMFSMMSRIAAVVASALSPGLDLPTRRTNDAWHRSSLAPPELLRSSYDEGDLDSAKTTWFEGGTTVITCAR